MLEVVGISSEEAERHMKGQNICPKAFIHPTTALKEISG